MGVTRGFRHLQERLEARGRSDLVPRLAESFAALAEAEKLLRNVELATGELLPICVPDDIAASVIASASSVLAELRVRIGEHASSPLETTSLAQLAHAVATIQTDDRSVAAWLVRIFGALNEATPAADALAAQTGDDAFFAVTLGRWFQHGCPVVRLDPRLAASLIFTEIGSEVDVADPPWPAFRIDVPPGLIPCSRKTDDAHVATVHVARSVTINGGIRWDWTLQDSARPLAQLYSCSTADRLESAPLADDFEAILVAEAWRPDALTRRLEAVVVRLMRGVLATMENRTSITRSRSKRKQSRWRLSKAPETIVFVLGRDVRVNIDCTAAVGAFVRGHSRSMPAVQWPVRGHWRNQACGPGLRDRRATWIQPHWKGPENAARLVRGHGVTSRGSEDG
jgi:hypothetical protein